MKNKLIVSLNLFIFLLLISPINIKALNSNQELLTCKYNYKTYEGLNKELIYKIYSNNSLEVPFSNGEKDLLNNTLWYSSDEFNDTYLESSIVDENIYTCPTITIEKSNNYTTVFNNVKDECNENCQILNASDQVLSNKEKNNNIKTKKIVETQIGSSVGIYNDTKYFLPYFRLFEDGTKQWSINGKKYISTNNTAIVETTKNIKTKITLNEDLINSIYKDNKINPGISIYRCVNKINKNQYNYLLTLTKNECTKDDISKTDGQANASAWYNKTLGAKKAGDNDITSTEDLDDWMDDYDQEQTCDGSNALLGDPNKEDSVAWLLQKILNYIKILGPMIVIVMSGFDFAQSIIQSDDENMAKAQKKLIIRLLLAASLFFVTHLVGVLLDIFGITANPTCGLK